MITFWPLLLNDNKILFFYSNVNVNHKVWSQSAADCQINRDHIKQMTSINWLTVIRWNVLIVITLIGHSFLCFLEESGKKVKVRRCGLLTIRESPEIVYPCEEIFVRRFMVRTLWRHKFQRLVKILYNCFKKLSLLHRKMIPNASQISTRFRWTCGLVLGSKFNELCKCYSLPTYVKLT